MARITLFSQDGTPKGEIELSATLFDVAPNTHLLHEAVVAQQASSRTPVAHTKGRGEVRGGGKKPWKQKGTGRARHGSSRSPIWVGGGVTFGPTKDRVFAKKMNTQARRKAFAMSLTDKVRSSHLVAVDDLTIAEGKTKGASQMLLRLPLAKKKTLVVLSSEEKNTARAYRNIARVTPIAASSLNVVDVLAHEYVLLSPASLSQLEKTFAPR